MPQHRGHEDALCRSKGEEAAQSKSLVCLLPWRQLEREPVPRQIISRYIDQLQALRAMLTALPFKLGTAQSLRLSP